jgi:regulator of sirC expression with transglutaminase-like and TPR domain
MPANPQLDYFRALVIDDEQLPLTEAAFAIAQDAYPQLDVQAELLRLDAWGQELSKSIPKHAPPAYRLKTLRHFFYDHLGFKGNSGQYYDVANSYLHKVVERRCGIPITLAVLLIELGKQIGLRIEGVSFPGHFLVKVLPYQGFMDEVLIDPFTGGAEKRDAVQERLQRTLSQRAAALQNTDALLAIAQPRMILVRMLSNLKGIYSEMESLRNLLAIQERLVILLPDAAEAKRDRGFLHAKLSNKDLANNDLNAYLAARPDAADKQEVQRALSALYSQL